MYSTYGHLLFSNSQNSGKSLIANHTHVKTCYLKYCTSKREGGFTMSLLIIGEDEYLDIMDSTSDIRSFLSRLQDKATSEVDLCSRVFSETELDACFDKIVELEDWIIENRVLNPAVKKKSC